MYKTFNDSNLEKNGITRREVLEIFESDLSFAMELDPSERGNDRAMIIGWTHLGRVLEIGIEYFQRDDREYIFHAMDASKIYRREFVRRLGHDD